jgi:hypothetical protein
MAYTPFGTWNNGTSPGISAAFLNALEAFLILINSGATDSNISAASGILTTLGIKANPTVVSVTGTTAGTATLYQALQGSVKLAVLAQNGYRNSTTTEQVITLPVGFTYKGFLLTGNTASLRPYTGASAQTNTARVLTGLSTSGGSTNLQSSVPLYSIGYISGSFDGIGLGISQSTPLADIAIIVGM